MSDDVPSIVSHVSIGTNDFERAIAFYDAVMPAVGARRVMEHPGAVAYGKQFPEFWVQTPIDETPATTGNGSHFGFIASSKEMVRAFHDAAIAAAPPTTAHRVRAPLYGEPYYGCFVRDPDGHKIEAAYWDMELARKLGMS